MNLRLLVLPLLAFACGDEVGNPITGGPDGGPGAADAANGQTSDGSVSDEGSNAPIDGGDAAPPVNHDPQLAVASANGVQIFVHAAALKAGSVADFALGSTAGASAMASDGQQLYVGRPSSTTSSLLRFAGSLSATSTPAATAEVPILITSLTATAGLLFVTSSEHASGDLLMFSNPAAITNSTAATATFAHPWHQMPAVTYDPAGDRLFVGQISGAGTLVWNGAKGRTGSVTHDFVLSAPAAAEWSMQIASNRLYGVGGQSATKAGVAIWSNASSLGAPATPLVLSTGYDQTKFYSDLAVRDDVLAIAAKDENEIRVYEHASTIAADRAPDFTLTNASLLHPTRLVIDSNRRLYATVDEGVLVFETIDTTPAFVAKIPTSGKPADLVLLE